MRICKFSPRLHRNQEGITGLETAIILIAFVIVASVFAYVLVVRQKQTTVVDLYNRRGIIARIPWPARSNVYDHWKPHGISSIAVGSMVAW